MSLVFGKIQREMATEKSLSGGNLGTVLDSYGGKLLKRILIVGAAIYGGAATIASSFVGSSPGAPGETTACHSQENGATHCAHESCVMRRLIASHEMFTKRETHATQPLVSEDLPEIVQNATRIFIRS